MFDIAAVIQGRRRLLAFGIAGAFVVGTAAWAAYPASAGSRFVEVHSADELTAALKSAHAGDTITLANGRYVGRFTLDADGANGAPITLRGNRRAIIDGGGARSGSALHLTGNYWHLNGFTVSSARVGLLADGAHQTLVDGLFLHDIGDEAIRFRDNSTDNVIQNSEIRDTGRHDPGSGAGVVLGRAQAEWTRGPDRSDRNKVLHNRIGPGVSADAVSAREGTAGGEVRDNSFAGLGGTWVIVTGNDYVVAGNSGRGAFRSGYVTGTLMPGFGCGNRFQRNTGSVAPAQADGWAFDIGANSACAADRANVVCDDNKVTKATAGFSTIVPFNCAPDPIPTAPVAGAAFTPPPAVPTQPATPSTPVTTSPVASGLTAAQVAVMDNLTAVFEYGLPSPRFDYVADRHDGCGYRAGWMAFCAGNGDVLDVVTRYSAASPDNVLARYLAPLQRGAALGPSFVTDWRTAASDETFRRIQLSVGHDRYLTPAVDLSRRLGVRTALGIEYLFDSALQMGVKSDGCDSVVMIANETAAALGGTPLSGIAEPVWLARFNEIRARHLLSPCTPGRQADWATTVHRVTALSELAAGGRWNLGVPLPVGADFDVIITDAAG
jgi:chitosanase